jgi:hypothetical protein
MPFNILNDGTFSSQCSYQGRKVTVFLKVYGITLLITERGNLVGDAKVE